MKRGFVLFVIALASTVSALAADIVLVSGPIPGPFALIGSLPAVAPTPEGFAVAWRDNDLSPAGTLVVHLRFARYDLAGARTLDSGPLPFDAGRIDGLVPRLLAVNGGFIHFSENDASEVWSVKIGPDGRQLSPGAPIITSGELYPFSVASSGGNVLLTYPEWIGTWTDWAVPIGTDGIPDGARRNVSLARSGQNLDYRFLIDSQLTATAGGFFTAWYEAGVGIRARDLGPSGSPRGDVADVVTEGCPRFDPAVAFVQGVEALVYAEGCGSTDLYLTTRRGAVPFGAPVTLADDPGSEGAETPFRSLRPLLAAGAQSSIGVLYSLVTPTPGGGSTIDWVFGEFGLDGRILGARVNLHSDLGIVTDGDVDLQWDPFHDRFLLAWAGSGPQGRGVYVMSVPSK